MSTITTLSRRRPGSRWRWRPGVRRYRDQAQLELFQPKELEPPTPPIRGVRTPAGGPVHDPAEALFLARPERAHLPAAIDRAIR